MEEERNERRRREKEEKLLKKAEKEQRQQQKKMKKQVQLQATKRAAPVFNAGAAMFVASVPVLAISTRLGFFNPVLDTFGKVKAMLASSSDAREQSSSIRGRSVIIIIIIIIIIRTLAIENSGSIRSDDATARLFEYKRYRHQCTTIVFNVLVSFFTKHSVSARVYGVEERVKRRESEADCFRF
jgi:hypothetical protein